jgi:hypothetical protein
MSALPAVTASTPEVGGVVHAPAAPDAADAAAAANGALAPAWVYRSEGFAEDLDAYLASEPRAEPGLLRLATPMVVLVGVVGLAAAFSLV